MNYCTTCKEDFASVRAFDRHRVGKHEYLYSEGLKMNPPREDGRRCLGIDEMDEHGLARDGKGRWCVAAEVEHAREYFHSLRGTRETASEPSGGVLPHPEQGRLF